jgi:hypothetical protein
MQPFFHGMGGILMAFNRRFLSIIFIIFTLCFIGCNTSGDDDDDAVSAGSVEEMIAEGIAFLEQGDGTQARTSFLSALAVEPENGQANYGLALADCLVIVANINPYFDLVSAFMGRGSYFVPQLEIDVMSLLEGLADLVIYFEEISTSVAFLQQSSPETTLLLTALPIPLDLPSLLAGQIEGPASLDLGGEWDAIDLTLLGMVGYGGQLLYDILLSHDLTLVLPNLNLPFANIIGNIMSNSPDFLTFVEGGQARWQQMPSHLADTLRQISAFRLAVEAEYASGDDQQDDVIPVSDTNGNGRLDFGDELNLEKSLPFTVTNELVQIMKDLFISTDAEKAKEQGVAFFDAISVSLDATIKSLEGTGERRISFIHDLNPLLEIWDFHPFPDVAELDLAALWDNNGGEPLRDLLLYYGCEDNTLDNNCSNRCSADDLVWITEEEPFTFSDLDTDHFTNFSCIGLDSIPRDNLYDVDNSDEGTNYVDLPSPTYMAFLDPNFSGTLYVNLDNFPSLADELLIPKPWSDCSPDGKCNEQCYRYIDDDCVPIAECDERCGPSDYMLSASSPTDCGSYDRDCHFGYFPECAAEPESCFDVCTGWCEANQYTVNVVFNWISLYFEHYVASVYNINFTEIIWK